MIKLSTLRNIASEQKERLLSKTETVPRELLPEFTNHPKSHALIIAGIRRCGKSTLIGQHIATQEKKSCFFINFDTPKLYNFDIHDFKALDEIINEQQHKKLYFDEIQIIEGWELYIRQKLDEGYPVIVTGSNASLLSKELGTKLTGRHITKELFPFSYNEFLQLNAKKNSKKAAKEYLEKGGFPEYLKHQNPEILQSLTEDILFRDIAVRFGIRDVSSLQRLLTYLVSNVGGLLTGNKLARQLGIKSTATIMEYLSYLEQTYLLNLLPVFSYSYRAQMVNPRKIYILDNGLVDTVSASFSENTGRKLENTVYWHLRQHYKELFYFNNKKVECDFIVSQKNKITQLIQVCLEVNTDNQEREEKGLWEAMEEFNLKSGLIVTLNQSDTIINGDKTIELIPLHHFLSKI